MQGDKSNGHPNAFINSDDTEAIGRVVQLIRQHRPQVAITNDETGGYFHPDHIRCYEITTAAFHTTGDPSQYPEFEFAPCQPQRLYYTALPKLWLNIFIWFSHLRGQDPTAFGRDKDIDFTKLGQPKENLHAPINFRQYRHLKKQASAAHASQGGGALSCLFPVWLEKRLFSTDTCIRAYAPVAAGFREYDLFNGYHQT